MLKVKFSVEKNYQDKEDKDQKTHQNYHDHPSFSLKDEEYQESYSQVDFDNNFDLVKLEKKQALEN